MANGSATTVEPPEGTIPLTDFFGGLENQYRLPPGMLTAVMQVESGGRVGAVSPAGARGSFQFMPATAEQYGIDPHNMAQSAEAAAHYLASNYNQFKSWDKALAAYNAGPGTVTRYGGIPPYPETQSYVEKILNLLVPAAQAAQPSEPPREEYDEPPPGTIPLEEYLVQEEAQPEPSEDYWRIIKEGVIKGPAGLIDLGLAAARTVGSGWAPAAMKFPPEPVVTKHLEERGFISPEPPQTFPGRLVDIGTQIAVTGGVNPLAIARGGAGALAKETTKAAGATFGAGVGMEIARANPEMPILGAAATLLGAAFGGHLPKVISDRLREVTLYFRAPKKAASIRLADALLAKQPGLSIDEALERARAFLAEGGDEAAMLADYQPGRGLALAVATMPGRGQAIAEEQLVGRALEGAERGAGKLKREIGIEGKQYGEEALRAAAERRASGPLFEQLRQMPWNPDPAVAARIQPVLELPLIRRFYAKAQAQVAAEQATAAARGTPFTTTETGVLHLTKSYLGQRARTLYKAGKAQEARPYEQAEDALREAIDEATGGHYKPALAAYAKPKQVEEALKEGRKLLEKQPHEIGTTLAQARPGEREALQLGAVQKVAEGQRSGAGSPFTSLHAPERLKRAQALVTEGVAQRGFPVPLSTAAERRAAIKQMVERESLYARTFSDMLRNSQTAQRVLAVREMEGTGEAIKGAITLATGGTGAIARLALEKLAQLKVFLGRPSEAERAELAKHLFATGEDARNALKAIEEGVRTRLITPRQAKSYRQILTRYAPGALVVTEEP